jgi:hypothetical protein
VEQAMVPGLDTHVEQIYSVIGGDYSADFFVSGVAKDFTSIEIAGEVRRAIQEVSVERFLDTRVATLLQQHKEGDKPIVVMDIGAGSATSLLRLADKYKDDVETSRLAFVATSLGTRIREFIDSLHPNARTKATTLY